MQSLARNARLSTGNAHKPQAPRRTVTTPVLKASKQQFSTNTQQQQQQQGNPNTHSTTNTTRRELLSSVAVLSTVAVATAAVPASPAHAAAAACELTSSPSGLQFCELKEGDGPAPVKGALIRYHCAGRLASILAGVSTAGIWCHYTGRLASNGRVFDSSYERGRPLNFKIGVREVIQGWDMGILGTEGVPPMKEGGKRLLLIPSELAYGSRGAGGVIPPNAQLEFEVELLGKRK